MSSPAVAALRSDLSAAGFTVDGLDALWGAEAAAALHRGQRIPAERALGSADGPLATLAALFVLGRPVPRERLIAALPSTGIEGALSLGLVTDERGADAVAPAVDLRPYSFVDALGPAEWWIVSDLGELAIGGPLPEDHVLGVGGASMTLSGLMLQRPVESVLDLGTGCGIQALHASRHARRVVATDISERALLLAALNAELNGIEGIDFRLGSMFEPVTGEQFDHIVSNPPFVITPRVEGVPSYEYRDGGMVGDELVAAFVAGCGEHLTPGGVAQLLGNWEYRGAGDAFDRVRGWVDGSVHPLDAWVIERDVEDAPQYAETWIRDGGTRQGTPGFDTMLSAWLDDFEARDVRQVGFGYVLLRRAEGVPTLRRFERMHGALGANEAGLGVHLGACLAAHDAQAALHDAAFGSLRLTVAGDVTEERHLWPGADAPTAILLRQGGGFGRVVAADTGLAALVGACDGELSVAAIIGALAQLLEVDEDALRADLVPVIRSLVQDGFLQLPA
ncbi:methyltransferase [Leifsonia sp. NPDC080035]|uniref:Methyltransferase n=1 Tax=Leifsonia sp. NPDC080035 TaxID=3143936 RepID=A0AAU7GD04_9MICO